MSASMPELPNVDPALFDRPTLDRLANREPSGHAPRFLLLYGSLRERSYSRLVTEEAGRLLEAMGGEPRIFNLWALLYSLAPVRMAAASFTLA